MTKQYAIHHIIPLQSINNNNNNNNKNKNKNKNNPLQ